MVVGSNSHQSLRTHDLQVHESQKLSCHFDLNMVSSCHTRGESAGHYDDEASKRGIHPGFQTQGRHHYKSKTRVSVAPQKGLGFLKL